MEPVSKRLKFDEDDASSAWTEDEIGVFFDSFKIHGMKSELIATALGRRGFRRGRAEVEALFNGHRTYLSSSAASALGLFAVVVDAQRKSVATEGNVDSEVLTFRAEDGLENTNVKSQDDPSIRRRPRKRRLQKHSKYDAMVTKLTDANAQVRNWLTNDLAVRWALAEWFYSTVEVQFFQWSEFSDALHTEMRIPNGTKLTRAEWGRVREAMCAMYPGGAKPRRLSPAFLAEERARLYSHVEKTRAIGSMSLAVRERVLAKHPWDGLPRKAMVASASANTPKRVRVSFSSMYIALVEDLDVGPIYSPSDIYSIPQAGLMPGLTITPTNASGQPGWIPPQSPSGIMTSPLGIAASPPRPMEMNSGVTLELDLRQLAEVLTLLDTKKEHLVELWKLNNETQVLTDEHIRRCGALSELNSTLTPLTDSLRGPVAAPANGSTTATTSSTAIPALAKALVRSSGVEEDQKVLLVSCVEKCMAVLFRAASVVHSWHYPTDLNALVDSLGFNASSNGVALNILKQAATQFNETVNERDYMWDRHLAVER
ncbi:hypothetical protein NDN08_004269 [Rhodosorus marinus]|uniref:DIRP domain-containing protein n=1 Tax=Rhodosorus marinus TaxID=101924 RepID=A0AAV8UQ03_9RHOD|nr:hypothetical protein NDN08_004269 [Rhodosorus marinus]